jgi:coproporphyrinogen III oxidase
VLTHAPALRPLPQAPARQPSLIQFPLRRAGLQEGKVWEKAGIAVSAVYGTMPGDAYRAAIGRDVPVDPEDRVPFFVTGISCVMHPWNPHCPTMHFNYR